MTKRSWIYRAYRAFWVTLDWLMPPVCGGCGKPDTRWCLDCQEKVQLLRGPVCEACGLPQAHLGLCSRCQQNRPSFIALRSWTAFEDPVQKALHRLKYRHDIGLGETLAKSVSGFVESLDWPVDTVVPIPLGKKRLKQRGYNQVAMVAIPLSLQLGLDYRPDALARAKETRTQVGLSAVERQENVRDAFQADARKVKERTVLLVDDVSTTGATLSSAAEALKMSGAREVYAVTVARALPHHSLKVV